MSVMGIVRITSSGDLMSRMKKRMMRQASSAPEIMLLTKLLIE